MMSMSRARWDLAPRGCNRKLGSPQRTSLEGLGRVPASPPTHEEPAFQLLCASVGQSGTRAEHGHIVASLVEFGVLDLFLCLSKWSETGEFLRIFSLGPC